MVPQLQGELAAEHQHDLRREAVRRRLAAEAAPPAALRLRVGRSLVSLGERIAGTCKSRITDPIS
jgi:hypothetical protein